MNPSTCIFPSDKIKIYIHKKEQIIFKKITVKRAAGQYSLPEIKIQIYT